MHLDPNDWKSQLYLKIIQLLIDLTDRDRLFWLREEKNYWKVNLHNRFYFALFFIEDRPDLYFLCAQKRGKSIAELSFDPLESNRFHESCQQLELAIRRQEDREVATVDECDLLNHLLSGLQALK